MSRTIHDLRTLFADPPKGSAPMMRWWWFGPTIERAEIDRELTAMAEAGLGGAEVAYVYPLEPATARFCDAEFLADLRYAADRAHELGLRLDLTLGSGWSFGGAHIGADLAARRLHWDRREITPGALTIPVVAPFPGDEFVAAYVGAGSIQETPDDWQRLEPVEGMITVPDGVGPRQVLIAYAQHTGQNVKRAAVGAEGPVLDHYSAAATTAHLRAVGDPMLDAVPAELLGSVFCDSLEVYESDWTPALPEEFERRNGYPLLPQLHLLAVDGPDAARLRADYHRTLTRLYEENFVAVIRRWAADRGVPFRLQGYGTPPATVGSYRFADLIEGEGWGWTEITETRWASSAAHAYGREVTSAEVWTWVHSPSFRATPLDLQGEAHEHFLNGVNQLIGHGWPYSPHDAPGLGWFFYASGALDDRNPWWPAMRPLARYLERLSWLLRQGDHVADVAVYVPNDDLFATMGRAQGGRLDAWRQAAARIDRRVPAAIRTAGLDYDLIDDEVLQDSDPASRRVVVVPTTTMLPDVSRAWLQQVIAAGGSVIMVDSTIEIAGAVVSSCDDLGTTLTRAIDPDVRVGADDIGVVHRRLDDADVYFVANTGPEDRAVTLTARTARQHWEEWSAHTGRALRGGAGSTVEVALPPYQATVIVMTDTELNRGDGDHIIDSGSRRVELTGPWTAAFADADPAPVTLPHHWEQEREGYSGSVAYRTTVDVPPATTAVLDLGAAGGEDAWASEHQGMRGKSFRAVCRTPVGEIAQVRVNGTDCGVVWAPPYRVDISAAVVAGSNEVEIVVSNTAANALAHDEHIRSLAVESERRDSRRFRMQELDKAMDGVRSGLFTVPSLVLSGAPGGGVA